MRVCWGSIILWAFQNLIINVHRAKKANERIQPIQTIWVQPIFLILSLPSYAPTEGKPLYPNHNLSRPMDLSSPSPFEMRYSASPMTKSKSYTFLTERFRQTLRNCILHETLPIPQLKINPSIVLYLYDSDHHSVCFTYMLYLFTKL